VNNKYDLIRGRIYIFGIDGGLSIAFIAIEEYTVGRNNMFPKMNIHHQNFKK